MKNVFKRSGTPLSKRPSARAIKRGLTLSAMLSAVFLAGCDPETGSTATTTESVCAGWRAITYSTKGDTARTVKQIRIHNRVGEKRKCW